MRTVQNWPRRVEFGATTGRARRCGWLDLVALKRAIQVNGVTGLCITKMDVLDGFKHIKLCTSYENQTGFPQSAAQWEAIKPVYKTLPGWQSTTRGMTQYEALPAEAKDLVAYIEQFTETPVAIISTGPERNENIIKDHPMA